MSHKREVSTQHSLARNRASRLQRRVEAVFRPQFRQGQSRREQLHVRSRHEILVRVLLVQSLAALGVRNEQSPLTFARGCRSQQRFRPRGESRRGLLRSRTLFLGAAARRLCFSFRLCAHAWRANSEGPHGARHRHCRTSLQDFLNSHSSLALKSFWKSIVQRQRILSPALLINRTNPCLKPVRKAPFLRPEVAPSLWALYDGSSPKKLRRGEL